MIENNFLNQPEPPNSNPKTNNPAAETNPSAPTKPAPTNPKKPNQESIKSTKTNGLEKRE